MLVIREGLDLSRGDDLSFTMNSEGMRVKRNQMTWRKAMLGDMESVST